MIKEPETLYCIYCMMEREYHTIMDNSQLGAYCNGCNSFIKNVAYEPLQFYFGKYQGKKLSEVEDIEYLKWFVINIKGNRRLKEAIKEKLNGEI